MKTDRIKYYRTQNGLSQQQLGNQLGFSEKTSGVRVAQYESGNRVPKDELYEKIACLFNIDVSALKVPTFETPSELLNFLFMLEDDFGFSISSKDGNSYLFKIDGKNINLKNCLEEWLCYKTMLENHSIDEDTYNYWKRNLPFINQEMKSNYEK